MMNTKNFLFIASVILLNSCTIRGFFSDYKHLTEEEKTKIHFIETNEDICKLKKDGKIYAITGHQLNNCVAKNEKVMIYQWVPHCHGETCYPLSHVQKYCNSHGLDFYVVASYYDAKRMFAEQENIDMPLFSINENYYKAKIRSRYTKLFMRDLLKDKKLTKEIWWHTSFVFNNGKLVDSRIIMEDENAGELKTIEF